MSRAKLRKRRAPKNIPITKTEGESSGCSEAGGNRTDEKSDLKQEGEEEVKEGP